MNESFKIRLRPKDGESLTSYLIRIAVENGTSIRKIIKHCIPAEENKQLTALKIAHLDILPRSLINMDLLSELLGIDRLQLEALTFTHLIDKLIINEKESDNAYFIMLSKVILSNKKRFCPECIKNNKYFKLLWQVEEIETCSEHLSLLQSICPICKIQIPYYFNEMHKLECPNCKTSLAEFSFLVIEDNEEVNNQSSKYNNWQYLINNKTELIPKIKNYSKEQSLAIALLNAFQINIHESGYNLLRGFKSTNFEKSLRKKASGIPSNYQIMLKQIISTINCTGLSAEQFSSMEVSDTFIESIIQPRKPTRNPPGPCLSPWCSSFGMNNSMVRIKDRRTRLYKNHIEGSVCLNCFMKFGYNRYSREWESIDDEVNLFWNKIKPLIDNGDDKKSIINKLKIPSIKICKAIGYLLNHNIINNYKFNIEKYYICEESLISMFVELIKTPGTMVKNAQKLYGWDALQFFYYLYNKKVQEFILFHSNTVYQRKSPYKEKGRDYYEEKVLKTISLFLEKDIDISNGNVAVNLKCSVNTIKKYNLTDYIKSAQIKQNDYRKQKFEQHLTNIADESIEEMRIKKKRASIENICEKAGMYLPVIDAKYPDISSKLREKVSAYNKNIVESVYQDKIALILEGMKTLYETGSDINCYRLANMTGLSYKITSKLLKVIEENNLFYTN